MTEIKFDKENVFMPDGKKLYYYTIEIPAEEKYICCATSDSKIDSYELIQKQFLS